MSIFHSYSVFHFYSRTMVSFITHQVAIDSARQVERGSCYGIVVQSNGATWVVQRDVASLTLLDRQLHYCVFDRGYSKLRDLEVLSTVSVKVSYLRHVIPFIEITEWYCITMQWPLRAGGPLEKSILASSVSRTITVSMTQLIGKFVSSQDGIAKNQQVSEFCYSQILTECFMLTKYGNGTCERCTRKRKLFHFKHFPQYSHCYSVFEWDKSAPLWPLPFLIFLTKSEFFHGVTHECLLKHSSNDNSTLARFPINIIHSMEA